MINWITVKQDSENQDSEEVESIKACSHTGFPKEPNLPQGALQCVYQRQ